MARYIDADALESELFRDGIAGIFLSYPRRRKFTIGEIRGMLKNERIAPTEDVVPRSEVEKAKQEVAREIFEEIEAIPSDQPNFMLFYINRKIAELKKKYIGE